MIMSDGTRLQDKQAENK